VIGVSYGLIRICYGRVAQRLQRFSVLFRARSCASPERTLERTDMPVTDVICDRFDLQVWLDEEYFRALDANPSVPDGESDSRVGVKIVGEPGRRKPADLRSAL